MKTTSENILRLLHQLYPAEQAHAAHNRIMEMLDSAHIPPQQRESPFSERDITLITYGNTLHNHTEAPLKTLYRFLNERLQGVISTVHILPFYPFSSDDGFSVIDYYAVNPLLGTWDEIRALGEDFGLMFDAVINHMSAQSPWFRSFLADDPAFRSIVKTVAPDADLSAVMRPRTTPLLTPFQKWNGELAHVWTTFSADQVDLNYSDPETLLRIIQVLLFYVEMRAQVLRLDAIAYMWKEIGTSCIHLPQTHAIIQLIRAVLDHVAPHVVLITETNVPHAENISYFGDGYNEAQMVYNFTLPPLLLHTLLTGDVRKLREWINTLDTLSERTTFFNFTASHDGIGVRPVEGILSAEEIQNMLVHVEKQKGRISYKTNPDGSLSPYELNITYVDAAAHPDESLALHIKRFILSQAVMLTLAGVPAVYVHSLLGSRNATVEVLKTGQNRRINRATLQIDTVQAELNNPQSWRARIFSAYLHLLQTRIQHPAFHPKAQQRALDFNDGKVLAIERSAENERVLALFNFTSKTQQVATPGGVDLLTGESTTENSLKLAPYQVCWLRH